MMRTVFYFLLVVCCTLTTGTVEAKSITREEAAARVEGYLKTLGIESLVIPSGSGMHRASGMGKEKSAYYVFSRGEGKGFVIASGDDRTVPVLGYTDKGDFKYEELPPNMQEWLDDYEKQIEFLSQQPSMVLTAANSAHPEVPILLTCNWGQDYPYNMDCPRDLKGYDCVTGCVATAMAQIMYYHRKRSVGATTKTMPVYHTGEFYVASIPQGAPIDWDHMLDNYPCEFYYDMDEYGNFSESIIDHFTDEQKKAVAQLMHYCGVSVQMKYSSGGSSAMSSDVAYAFKQYFGYCETVQHISRSNYSATQWDDIIYSDISQGSPVYLSGANSGGGHAFVCDGYDGKGYYHINWGWDGYCNGFFLLSNLTPDSQGTGGTEGGYNSNQEAVVGIVPAISFKDKKTKQLCVNHWDTDGNGELSYDEAAVVTDFGEVFAGSGISSFDEIQYFTGLSSIADNAFNGCSCLSALTIPENINHIGTDAFNGCSSLMSIKFPKSLEVIGDNAFKDCAAISSIELPENIHSIGGYAFEGCVKLASFAMKSARPSSIILGENVFSGVHQSSSTLIVLEGTKSFYELALQWNAFGIIREVRTKESENYNEAQELQKLLDIAQGKNVNSEREQAIMDDIQSTKDEILQAQHTLRRKLGFVSFVDPKVKQIAQSLWDLNYDGELTKAELSNVKSDDIDGMFRNSDIEFFEEFEFFTGLTYVPDSCFYGCKLLRTIIIPENIEQIWEDAFNGCSSLEKIKIPFITRIIAEGCFVECTSLASFYMDSPTPIYSSLWYPSCVDEIFGDVDLSEATLYVPLGSKSFYGDDDVWGYFGEIKEVHTAKLPEFAPLEVDERVYIYNVGERRFINTGEAWGTQAVVAPTGLVYKVRQTSAMPEGVYYLEAENTATANRLLYRTDQDSKVGIAQKACFIDGTLNENAYWHIMAQDDGTYRIQVPENTTDYVEGEYLGTSIFGKSDFVYNSKGLYYDGDELDMELGLCDWAFIRVSDYEKGKERENLSKRLAVLINRAKGKNIDVSTEEQVYDNMESTNEEISHSIQSIREKLHYIDFLDERTKTAFIARWDLDDDDELSLEEAAKVTYIGQTFQGNTTIIELEELKYFVNLTEIPANAFKGMSKLQLIYIPENVAHVGDDAFKKCESLKSVAILNDNTVLVQGLNGIPSLTTVTLFVPMQLLLSYQNDEYWSKKCHEILEYTGVPVVSAWGDRQYGRTIGNFQMKIEGAPFIGEPEMVCDIRNDKTAPVGDYPIIVRRGNIINPNAVFKEGVYRVKPAPLTITATSYVRGVGEQNPPFELTYKGFRNRDTEDVLTTLPFVECNATIDSPAGEYEIRVSGARALNYEISYVSGILSIVEADGIIEVMECDLKKDDNPVFDLLGRRVSKKGICRGWYIIGGKKVFVK